MKKKSIVLTLLALAGAATMVACSGGNEEKSSSVTEEPTSSESAATVAGRIIVNSKMPSEIEVNTTLDLEQYVTVTKVDTWSVETDSDNIKIEGHKIKGIDYGSFRLRIVAGTTKKAIDGYIVSKEKLAFNKVIESISNNYTAQAIMVGSEASTTYDTPMGMAFHNANYFAAQETDSSHNPTKSFSGYLTAPDKNAYSFSYEADKDDGSNPTNFVVEPGIQRSIDNYYLGGTLSILGTDYVEVLDKEGNPSGVYELKNRTTDDYGSTLVGDIGSTTLRGLTLDSFVSKYSATFYSSYDEKSGAVAFELVGTVKDQTSALGLAIFLGDINKTGVEPIDSWLASPAYPEPYAVNDLKAIFSEMNEKKSYKVESDGYWLNTSTGEKASASEAAAASKAANGLFFTYNLESYVTEDAYYSVINSVSGAESYNGAGFNFAEDATEAYFIRDNKLYSVNGARKVAAEGNSVEWGKAAVSSDIVAGEGKSLTIWDTNLSSAYFTDVNLDKANWNRKVTLTNGLNQEVGIGYYFTEQGEDNGQLIYQSLMQIGNLVGAALWTNFTKNYAQFSYQYWVANKDGTASFINYVPWGTVGNGTYYYFQESTFKDIGTTAIPAEANIAGIVTGDSTSAA